MSAEAPETSSPGAIGRTLLHRGLPPAAAVAAVAFAAGLVTRLHAHRAETLGEVVARPALWLLAAGFLAAVLVLALRRRLIDVVDRRFFPRQRAAAMALRELADDLRRARSPLHLAELFARGVRRALDVDAALLMVGEADDELRDPLGEVRPLPSSSSLYAYAAARGEPTPLRVEDAAVSATLEQRDLHWLLDHRVRLLVAPPVEGNASPVLLGLGRKGDGEPYLPEERRLIQRLATAVARTLEDLRREVPETPSGIRRRIADEGVVAPLTGAERATECPGCNRVHPPDLRRCPTCELGLETAPAPHVLRGVFRLEERIGTGSMAVVYAARDLKLGRTVAIKTLPRISAEAAVRLHREARASAAVSHPGLAAIYGLETWEGTPLLILEHLEGGTVADRLTDGRLLTVEEVVRVGRSVASALDKLHSAGVLHRDVKPSNIGFTADGEAKLLDFGIAKILDGLRRDSAFTDEGEAGWSTVWHYERSLTGNVTGTLPYAAPELLRGASPSPATDLWALAVVLFEASTGENLFRGRSLKELIDRIREAKVPDLDSVLPSSPLLAAFFRSALSRDPAERPQSGAAIIRWMDDVERGLAGDGAA